MSTIVTIGLDLSKSVFQIHGVDDAGRAVLRRRLSRHELVSYFAKLPGCLVGMEACSAAHHWARELSRLGHSVRLIPPQYVKPYVKRNKTDAADAEAICEAVAGRTCGLSRSRRSISRASCRCTGFARCSSANALPRSTRCGDC
jgi:transposase